MENPVLSLKQEEEIQTSPPLNEIAISTASDSSPSTSSTSTQLTPSKREPRKNPFPENITIEEARKATKFPGFREAHKADYIIFNYDFSFRESFPDPLAAQDEETARLLAIRRECRGLIFSKETQKVISRRLHKFFNIDELPETRAELIDISRPHIILEKMDGCLVAPFITEGKLRFGSKMGVTEMSNRMEETFLVRCGIDYHAFCLSWIERGYTPMFEWCSAQQQIVVGYEEDQLILIALRHNDTGMYLKYEELAAAGREARIPVVKAWGGTMRDVTHMLNWVKEAEGLEGFVLCFQDNGEMFKMKSEWYFERSKKVSGSMVGSQEKDIWLLILDNKLDDIAITIGPKTRERIEKFASDLFMALDRSAAKIQRIVDEARSRDIDKRSFVIELKASIEAQKKLREAGETIPEDEKLFDDPSVYFAVFDGKNALKHLVGIVKTACSNKNKLDRVRYLAGGLKFDL